MKPSRGGLGRGLGALIPTSAPREVEQSAVEVAPPPTQRTSRDVDVDVSRETSTNLPSGEVNSSKTELSEVPGAQFREIPLGLIVPNPKQPRTVFDEEALEELKMSISEVGVLQPIVVRERGLDTYELIMGERRFRACEALGKESVPAIVRDTHDDEMLRDALLENIHRANLNPLEEAAAYQQLMAEFGASQEELAKKIGRSRPQISNTIRLLNLPAPVQRRVAAGVLSAGHARALLSLQNPEQQEELAQRIVAEGLSVRATEELVLLMGNEKPAISKKSHRKRFHSPGVANLSGRLSDRFDTRVTVDIGKRKGKIVVEFATVDDLERIAQAMGVTASIDEL